MYRSPRFKTSSNLWQQHWPCFNLKWVINTILLENWWFKRENSRLTVDDWQVISLEWQVQNRGLRWKVGWVLFRLTGVLVRLTRVLLRLIPHLSPLIPVLAPPGLRKGEEKGDNSRWSHSKRGRGQSGKGALAPCRDHSLIMISFWELTK